MGGSRDKRNAVLVSEIIHFEKCSKRGVAEHNDLESETLVKETYFEGSEFFRREGAGKDIDGDVCVEFSETMTRDCISWLTNIRFAKIELSKISTA